MIIFEMTRIKNTLDNLEHGFTIVELLIVIVVIAILAAVTVVSYSGIQERAKNASYKDAALQLEKKIKTWVVIKGDYPWDPQVADDHLVDSEVPEAALGQDLMDKIITGGNPVTKDYPVVYRTCESDGAEIEYLVLGDDPNVVLSLGDTSTCTY